MGVRVGKLVCCVQVVIGALESCGDIVAVSSCQNEVFILKGDRDIIRISSCPEGQTPCKTPYPLPLYCCTLYCCTPLLVTSTPLPLTGPPLLSLLLP